ncbi:hypothetical protein TNCV_507061 [Trichonephila clavipes]|nr:hypothetical protein TNCV_507061 [Trichonephila clavipes]
MIENWVASSESFRTTGITSKFRNSIGSKDAGWTNQGSSRHLNRSDVGIIRCYEESCFQLRTEDNRKRTWRLPGSGRSCLDYRITLTPPKKRLGLGFYLL